MNFKREIDINDDKNGIIYLLIALGVITVGL